MAKATFNKKKIPVDQEMGFKFEEETNKMLHL
jgi:hypothetical protein